MNKIIHNIFIITLSLSLIFFMISSNRNVIESVSFSISLWKDNLFPTLFPFFIVSNVLIQYGCVELIGSLIGKIMNKIFKLPSESGFVLVISLFSGFPSGAKYINELVKEEMLSIEDANRLLTFTHYSNPLFILGFISNIFNKNIALIILVSHVLGGLITGFILNYNKELNNYKANKKHSNNKTNSLGKILHSSIMDSLNTMFLLLGIVTIFVLITNMIQSTLDLSDISISIISGLIEITQGIKNISLLNIDIYFKILLTTLFISFGGLSIHTQVLSIIEESKIKYKYFFVARIIHSILSIILVSILYLFL